MADWYGGLNSSQLHVQAYESSYDVNGNYSIVQINVWIERVSGTGKYSSYTDNSWIDYVDGGGFQSGSGTYDLRGGGSQLLLSGAATVYHNADGTRTVSISGSFSDPHGNLGSTSAGGSLGLTTIPRATQPTVSPTSGQTDANYTVSYAGASTGFTHDLYYSLDGGSTYTLLASALTYNGTYVWTPASSLLPDATGVTAIIRLDTKSGGTLIGTKTVSLPLTVPATIIPVVSSVSWTDAQTSAPDIPTLMGGAGRYVQGWSKLQPTAVSAGASGSTVTSCKITVNAQTTDSGSAFGSAVALSGAVPYSAVATDSRGRSSVPYTGTVPVTAYSFPNLAGFTVTRTSDAAGNTPSPTGAYLSIAPTASVSDLTFGGVQKNLLEYQIEIAPKSTGVFTVVSAWGSTGVSGNTWTAKRVFGTYASSSEWIVRVTIRDVFGKNGYNTGSTVVAKSLNIPSEAVFMDWDQGVGIGLGKYRAQGILDIKGDVYDDGTSFLRDVTATNQMIQRATHKVLDDGSFSTPIGSLSPDLLYEGTIASPYSTGLVPVTLSDGTTVLNCSLGSQDLDIRPSGSVIVARTGSSTGVILWVTATTPKFPIWNDLVLQNGWVWNDTISNQLTQATNEGGPVPAYYHKPQYTKTSGGFVDVAGYLKNTGGTGQGGVNQIVAQLPVGYRPLVDKAFVTLASNGTTVGVYVEAATGYIRMQGALGTGIVGFFLDGISFTADSTLSWTSLSSIGYLNGWADAGGSLPAGRIAVDSNNRVFIEGKLKKTGSAGTGTRITNPLPAQFQPNSTMGNTITLKFDPAVSLTRVDTVYGQGLTDQTGHSGQTALDLSGGSWLSGAFPASRWVVPGYYSGGADYGAGYPSRGWAKTDDGMVQFRGLMAASYGGNVFEPLPVDHRPSGARLFPIVVSPNAVGSFVIYPDGSCYWAVGSGWEELNPIRFVAEQ